VFKPVWHRIRQDSSENASGSLLSTSPYSAETKAATSELGEEYFQAKLCVMLNQTCAQKHAIFNAGPENQNPFSRTNTLCHPLGSSEDTYTSFLDFSMM